jgi:hypothetical protein
VIVKRTLRHTLSTATSSTHSQTTASPTQKGIKRGHDTKHKNTTRCITIQHTRLQCNMHNIMVTTRVQCSSLLTSFFPCTLSVNVANISSIMVLMVLYPLSRLNDGRQSARDESVTAKNLKLKSFPSESSHAPAPTLFTDSLLDSSTEFKTEGLLIALLCRCGRYRFCTGTIVV